MIEEMVTVRISEAELARDLHGVLEQVQEGVEVIVEQDHRAVAVIKTPQRSGWPLTEILREAKQRNSTVTLDEDFAATSKRSSPDTSASHGIRPPGLVLDSGTVIRAERNNQSIPDFIEAILQAHGSLDLSLSPVTVAEPVLGIYCAKTSEAARRRREYIEELVNLVPVHPATKQTAWLVGQIEGQDRGERKHTPV